MICQCLADQLFAEAELRQIIDLLATDKSRYFAQPRPIIVNCLCQGWTELFSVRILVGTGLPAKLFLNILRPNRKHLQDACTEEEQKNFQSKLKALYQHRHILR